MKLYNILHYLNNRVQILTSHNLNPNKETNDKAMTKQTRIRLTYEEKLNIIKLWVDRNCPTYNNFSPLVLSNLHIQLKESSFYKIISEKERIESLNPSQLRRHADSKMSVIEDSLESFILDAETKQLPINYDIIQIHARQLTKGKFNKEISLSNTFINSFLKRNKLKKVKIYGDALSLSIKDYEEELSELRLQLNRYNLCDIYNYDETALFFQLLNSYSIGSNSFRGFPKNKNRITVGICLNADGSHILPPLIVNKSKKPHCFGNFNPNSISYYYNNKKAWVTKFIFQDFLKVLGAEVKKDIVLVVDNCSAHTTAGLTIPDNILLLFLPPKTTSITQPLDLGIIKTLKTFYRKQVIYNYYIQYKEKGAWTLINTKEAILEAKLALEQLKETTIFNCWKKSTLIKDILVEENINPDNCEENKDNNEYNNNLLIKVMAELNISPTVEEDLEKAEELIMSGMAINDEEDKFLEALNEDVDYEEEDPNFLYQAIILI